MVECRAVDPHSFFADPDPADFLIADPDPGGNNFQIKTEKNAKKIGNNCKVIQTFKVN